MPATFSVFEEDVLMWQDYASVKNIEVYKKSVSLDLIFKLPRTAGQIFNAYQTHAHAHTYTHNGW